MTPLKNPNNPIRLLIDMDGVMMDYYGQFLKYWQTLYPGRPFIPKADLKDFFIEKAYPPEYKPDIKEIMCSKSFFHTMEPMTGAVEAMAKIIKDPRFVANICTAPDLESVDQCCWTEKALVVQQYFGEEWLKKLIVTKDKTLVRAKYLLDDKPSIRGSMSPEWTQIVFAHPYNENTITGLRLENWAGWDDLAEALVIWENANTGLRLES